MFSEVETSCGKIMGLRHGAIHQFKGVPYGASTAGANRFCPPQAVKRWAGVRECIGYGFAAPQFSAFSPGNMIYAYARLLHADLQSAIGGMSEGCLCLNIWTPSLRDGAKRAVVLSIHGGGFGIGSGNLSMYDGAALAELGDVVVVTVNHRLNAFGFLELAGVDESEEAAFSSVAGLMDIVAALEWVKENIEAFGGDASNVTVVGQSGGGWKTSALLGAPSAKGLFHKAVVQSGSLLRVQTREQCARVTHALLKKLDLPSADLHRLQTVPWHRLVHAAARVSMLEFWPTLDGAFLPRHPFDPVAPEASADVPLMVSSTLEDASYVYPNADIGDAEVSVELVRRFDDAAPRILKLYREAFPDKAAFLLLGQIVTDATFRRYESLQADRKVVRGGASVYAYRWDHATPAFNGRLGATHGIDVSAMFYNVHEAAFGAGLGEGPRLAHLLASSFLAFSKFGNPNAGAISDWKPYDMAGRATMIFDRETRCESDPQKAFREFWAGMPLNPSVGHALTGANPDYER